MHESSMMRMECFIKNYCAEYEKNDRKKRILDIGSYCVNGTYKRLFPESKFEYVGLDVVDGPNVDVVPNNMYNWEIIENESFDYIISGQAFEHIEYPWLTISEMKKKLKESGIICIIAPNGLREHRYPTDCWRFYSDGMRALANWCGLEVIEVSVGGVPDLYSSKKFDDIWNDVCLVACKSSNVKNLYKDKHMFPVERRYDAYSNLKLQNEFLGKWKYEEEKIDHYITDYIKRKQYDFVYIVGEGYLVYSLNKIMNQNNIRCKCIQEDCLVSIDREKDCKQTLYIITSIDVYRLIKHQLKEYIRYAGIQYLDYLVQDEAIYQQVSEYKNYFKACQDIYIYGMGGNGRRIEKILDIGNLSFSGFVISDEKMEGILSDKDVYMISQISNNSGIIVSPYDNQEIYRILKDKNFKYVIDGLSIIKNASLYASDRV